MFILKTQFILRCPQKMRIISRPLVLASQLASLKCPPQPQSCLNPFPIHSNFNLLCVQRSKSSVTSTVDSAKPKVTSMTSEYKIFYRFPHIRLARLITRLKLYQTGLTVAMIPMAWYCHSAGIAPVEVCYSTVAVSSFAAVMLYVMSGFLRRLVCLLAANETGTIVRLSCLDFWGGRRDVYVKPDDLVPLMDVEVNMTDIFINVKRYSTNEQMYMTLKFGNITNKEQFMKVFGKIL